MFFENTARFLQSGVDGPVPSVWYGPLALDGDAYPWLQAPVGSIYYYINGQNQKMYQKMESAGRDSDWALVGGMGVIVERVLVSDFTDGGAAVGTYTSTQVIPAGAFVLRTVLTDVTGFTGDTSCALTVGDGTTADRYNTSTINIFATAVALDGGAVSGTAVHAAAKSPVLTATSGSDWGAVTAGALTLKIFYMF